LDFSGDSAQTIFVIGGNTVFRSLDAGLNWIRVFDSTLLLVTLNQINYHANTSSVYVAGSDGVESRAYLWRSTDLGNNWLEVPLNISDPIYCMEVANDGSIYLATPNAGVFKIDPILLEIESGDRPTAVLEFRLEQNYPNPFNQETTIHFYLSVNSLIHLEIFNMLGEHIRTIYHGNMHTGSHTFRWNGRNDAGALMSSGIYFVRLTGESDQQQKRIILLK